MGARRACACAIGLGSLLGALHCGGKAVVDGLPPGVGGTGGTAGTTGGTAGTTGSTSGSTSTTSDTSTTSTSTGPLGALCQQACDLLAGCDVQASCVTRCQATAPECSSAQQTWLECLLADLVPESCMPSGDCQGAFDDWRGCGLVWHSITVHANGADGSCQSSSEIAGGAGQLYDIDCAWDAAGFDCQCIVDAQPVGQCLENTSNPSGPCDPMYGCCTSLFFVPFGPASGG
jgi:hypothetical protein